mmetsp:Transcript_53547/g.125645  ORF Transcript_53547/g.125645 Transcript_53547/m.125645 type:complete len:226 (-) Transcript_53547:57-734(-)
MPPSSRWVGHQHRSQTSYRLDHLRHKHLGKRNWLCVPKAHHQVGRLAHVIALATRPNQHVVCKVPHDVVSLLFRVRQRSAKCSDVFVIPSIAICNRGSVSYAGDLVAVVPPCHDPRIRWRVSLQPLVSIKVVRNEPLAALEDDGRMPHVRRDLLACRNEILDRITHVLVASGQNQDGHSASSRPTWSRKLTVQTLGCLEEVRYLRGQGKWLEIPPKPTINGSHAS